MGDILNVPYENRRDMLKIKKLEGKLKFFFLKYSICSFSLKNIYGKSCPPPPFFSTLMYYPCDHKIWNSRLLSVISACNVLYLEFTLVSVVQGEGTLLATGSYDGQARIWATNGMSFFSIIIFCTSISGLI